MRKTVLDIFKQNYKDYCECACGETIYEWAASHVFGFATYDGGLDEMFVKKIVEVCKVILERKNFEYIRNEDNYIVYILVCQLLDNFNWIEWGTSIRGAWFGEVYSPHVKSRTILWITDDTEDEVPFTVKNLEILIKFIEEETKNYDQTRRRE